MTDLPALLSDIRVHGYVGLWVVVFLGSAGIPLPTDLLLLAAGALAGHGELNWAAAALVAVSAAACGDAAGYFVGWRLGKRAMDWLEHSRVGRRLIPASTLERGRTYFEHFGGWAIFLSRWLAGMFSGVVNLLAGMRRYPFRAFIAYAIAGEALDTALMLGVGIAFGATLAAAEFGLKLVLLSILVLLGLGILAVRLLRPLWRERSTAPQAHRWPPPPSPPLDIPGPRQKAR